MATYYVRASGGNNGNDGLSFATAWATIVYAEATVSPGDTVLICADAVHSSYTTGIVFENNLTTPSTPIRWIGANATGVVDGTMATISGVNLTSGPLIRLINTGDWIFKHLRFTRGKTHCMFIYGSFIDSTLLVEHCRFDTATTHGIYSEDNSSQKRLQFVNVEVDSNGSDGVYKYFNQRGQTNGLYLNCSIHNNGRHGLFYDDNQGKTTIIGCRFYRNAGAGFYVDNEFFGITMMNNVFFANTSHGINLNTAFSAYMSIQNNIFKSNGGYGINAVSTTVDQFTVCDYNCSYGNVSGHTNINSGMLPGANNVYTDPQFTSETAGAENFMLTTPTSPCIDAGTGYRG